MARLAVLLPLLLVLPACQAARDVDAAMRRFDLLDRVFEPDRGSAPPPPAAPRPPTRTVATTQSDPPRRPEPLLLPQAEVDALSRSLRLRRNPWLTRFWSELTPAERAEVTARLDPQDGTEPAVAWDRMGLDDRVDLIFDAP